MTALAVQQEAAGWTRCESCASLVYGRRLTRSLGVCPECGRHGRLTAPQRIAQLLDDGSTTAMECQADVTADPLGFTDSRPYLDRLTAERAKTGLRESVICATGTIGGHAVVVAAMDFRFMGGSLGAEAGELITQAAERALTDHVPLILVTASGGARMQEGVVSLMQMPKTCMAVARLDEAGVMTVSVITDPTFGGVAASFASLSDVIIAEPRARMGFAGPRVIQQTIRRELPEGFQTAEFLMAHGLIDGVVPRPQLRQTLTRLLSVQGEPPAARPVDAAPGGAPPTRNAWETVALARNTGRPTATDYIGYLLDGFQELRGDRSYGDCPAIVGGTGMLDGLPVMVISQQKGHTTRELVERNFGMASPQGYRKAIRLMRLAAKWRIPVLTLIDTPGAYPGAEAEELGQSMAIAESQRVMASLPVPVVAVVTGEGGSGGAVALGVADKVLACANAVYSVISPEGCAAILWGSASAAPRAAESLCLDARSLLALEVVDGIVPEPPGGAHQDPAAAAASLRTAVVSAFAELLTRDAEELVLMRRARFRRYGLAHTTTGRL